MARVRGWAVTGAVTGDQLEALGVRVRRARTAARGLAGASRWPTRTCPERTTNPRPHRDHTSTAFCDLYDVGNRLDKRERLLCRPVEDYTNKYKGEQVELALFGGEYQEGVLTAYCSIED